MQVLARQGRFQQPRPCALRVTARAGRFIAACVGDYAEAGSYSAAAVARRRRWDRSPA
ncbi:hypothetical protein GOC23_33100 [Sinorhizobium meliloti]|nr:hypothetical protein [Sinorhizobium meliloti]